MVGRVSIYVHKCPDYISFTDVDEVFEDFIKCAFIQCRLKQSNLLQ